MANIERATEREFGVYCISQARFMNLDFLGLFDESEYLTKEAEEIPENGLYSFEEASRFIIHCDDRADFKIINCKSPRYLVDFELAVYRKQRQEKLKKEQIQYNQEQEQNIRSQNAREGIASAKQNYFKSLENHRVKLNSQATQVNGQFGEVLKQQPKMSDFALVESDFTNDEKVRLRNYRVAGV